MDPRWARIAVLLVAPLLLMAALSTMSGQVAHALDCASPEVCANGAARADLAAHGSTCGGGAACGAHRHLHSESLVAAIEFTPVLATPAHQGHAEVHDSSCPGVLLEGGLFHPPRSSC